MNASGPETLTEAVMYFADPVVCHDYMAKLKWPDGVVVCPRCGSTGVGFIHSRRMYQCRGCRKQFSVKVGTIFEDSPLPLSVWFVVVWSITNAKNGISSCEIARATGITQKSAWFVLHRVRDAMKTGSFNKFTGEVESDETYIGGLSKNMHKSRRREAIKGTGGAGKAIVHGLMERHTGKRKTAKRISQVKAAVVPNVKAETLVPILNRSIEPGSSLYTDTLAAYKRMETEFVHSMIDHAEAYVRGRCHTNSMENFWALFKRCIKGTYVSVDVPHLGRYVDEEVFRFNERDLDDGQRFNVVMPGVVGKRLTYKTLIGENDKEGALLSDTNAGRDTLN